MADKKKDDKKAGDAKKGGEKAAGGGKKVKILKEKVKIDPKVRKNAYFERLTSFLQTYQKVMIIKVDNVGAAQLARVRKQFRGSAEVLMGKNTLIRKCIRTYIEAGHPEFEALFNAIKGNVGLVFTNGDMRAMRNEITEYRVPAPAKAGIVAPSDVHIPAGPTGLEPTATAFLQALNIPSKIVKGQVEVTSVVHLIKKGDRVKPGASALLQKLKITPFTYGIDVEQVYSGGFVYSSELLDLTDRDVLDRFARGVTRIAALSLKIGYPTLASVPHTIVNAYKSVLGVAVKLEGYNFGPVADLKERIKNPGAFAPVNNGGGGGGGGGGGNKPADAPAPVAAEPPPKEESEEGEMELDLFG